MKKEYGRWQVIGPDPVRRRHLLCRCSCGTVSSCYLSNLVSGTSTKCRRCRDDDNIGEGNGVWSGFGLIPGKYWGSLRNAAKRDGKIFLLSIEYGWSLFESQNGKCAISGVPIFFMGNRSIETTASLDRIDSDLGYIDGNVWWVHKDVNALKSDFPLHQFVMWCKIIAEAQCVETEERSVSV